MSDFIAEQTIEEKFDADFIEFLKDCEEQSEDLIDEEPTFDEINLFLYAAIYADAPF